MMLFTSSVGMIVVSKFFHLLSASFHYSPVPSDGVVTVPSKFQPEAL